ncbi:hypothetical protein NDU88_003510 [Pleurodeles waltl]|uniref:Uncharacterized protein n=1 Tax=Pleurodeles waltl TaxID=8319 RepID=A0AAV7NJG2_PLEWA|nr:hypothetical protein NDU88_003510 [Pleurodeles waltl]
MAAEISECGGSLCVSGAPLLKALSQWKWDGEDPGVSLPAVEASPNGRSSAGMGCERNAAPEAPRQERLRRKVRDTVAEERRVSPKRRTT